MLQDVIIRVGASVRLGHAEDVGIGTPTDPERLPVAVQLFADTAIGGRLSVARATIVGGMPRGGATAIWKRFRGPARPHDPDARRQMLEDYRVQPREVEDTINSALGRDPEQIRPFSLSWGPLIELLTRHEIRVSEDELIATPFVFEFSDELLAELAPHVTPGS